MNSDDLPVDSQMASIEIELHSGGSPGRVYFSVPFSKPVRQGDAPSDGTLRLSRIMALLVREGAARLDKIAADAASAQDPEERSSETPYTAHGDPPPLADGYVPGFTAPPGVPGFAAAATEASGARWRKTWIKPDALDSVIALQDRAKPPVVKMTELQGLVDYLRERIGGAPAPGAVVNVDATKLYAALENLIELAGPASDAEMRGMYEHGVEDAVTECFNICGRVDAKGGSAHDCATVIQHSTIGKYPPNGRTGGPGTVCGLPTVK